MRRLVQVLFAASALGASLLACSTSSDSPASVSFVDACSGEYSCTTNFEFLTYLLSENGITVFPDSDDPTSCLVGARVQVDNTVVMKSDAPSLMLAARLEPGPARARI